jgi:hypothetical protein
MLCGKFSPQQPSRKAVTDITRPTTAMVSPDRHDYKLCTAGSQTEQDQTKKLWAAWNKIDLFSLFGDSCSERRKRRESLLVTGHPHTSSSSTAGMRLSCELLSFQTIISLRWVLVLFFLFRIIFHKFFVTEGKLLLRSLEASSHGRLLHIHWECEYWIAMITSYLKLARHFLGSSLGNFPPSAWFWWQKRCEKCWVEFVLFNAVTILESEASQVLNPVARALDSYYCIFLHPSGLLGPKCIRREATASAEAGLVFGLQFKESTIPLMQTVSFPEFLPSFFYLNTLRHQRHHLFTSITTKP